MTTRTARLIRAGILAARDPERMKHIRAAHPVVRAAARREEVRIQDRALLARLKTAQAMRNYNLPFPAHFDGFVYVETGDTFKDAANRLAIFGATGTIPQRIAVGIDPKEHA